MASEFEGNKYWRCAEITLQRKLSLAQEEREQCL